MLEIITADDLAKIYYLKKDLTRLEDTIKEARERTISSPSFEFHPSGGSKNSAQERYVESTEHYISQLLSKRRELCATIEQVEEFINSIQDPIMRLIIHYRCVECLNWEQVAKKVGSNNTATSVRVKYCRFVAENLTCNKCNTE